MKGRLNTDRLAYSRPKITSLEPTCAARASGHHFVGNLTVRSMLPDGLETKNNHAWSKLIMSSSAHLPSAAVNRLLRAFKGGGEDRPPRLPVPLLSPMSTTKIDGTTALKYYLELTLRLKPRIFHRLPSFVVNC